MYNALTIEGLFHILRKRLALLIIFPMLIAAGTLLTCRMLPNHYTATASLFVAVRYADAGGNLRFDVSAGNSLVSDYKALFERSPVLKMTGEALNIQDLSKAIRFDIVGVTGTRIVEIRATGRDAALCADAANTASQLFIQYLAGYMGVDSAGVTQQAEIPLLPSTPKPLQFAAIAYLLTFSFSTLCVLVFDQVKNRVKGDSQVLQMGLPLLASIPDYRKRLRHLLAKKEALGSLYRCMPEPVRESVKAAALNILDVAPDFSARALAITSILPHEGKSSFAVLLASAYVEQGNRVLLVDMDFRNPSLATLLQAHGQHDLIDCLTGHASLKKAAIRTRLKDLYLLDSHHRMASASRIAASSRFAAFVEQALNAFDILLFDTPPLGLFIDAALLAARLDGTVLTLADNQVSVAQLTKAMSQLAHSRAEVLGVVRTYVKMPKTYYQKGKRKQRASRGAKAGRALWR